MSFPPPLHKTMPKIKLSQIQDEYLGCPYCMDGPKREYDHRGCCGESSAHFAQIYDLGDELVLADYVEVVE